jgi:hypothetical protein
MKVKKKYFNKLASRVTTSDMILFTNERVVIFKTTFNHGLIILLGLCLDIIQVLFL